MILSQVFLVATMESSSVCLSQEKDGEVWQETNPFAFRLVPGYQRGRKQLSADSE